MSGISESAGNPAVRRSPVAVVVVTQRHPPAHALVVTVGVVFTIILGKVSADLRGGVVEAFAGLDAGNEEFLVFPSLAIDGDRSFTAVPRLDVGVELL